jgi:hypothetical protein
MRIAYLAVIAIALTGCSDRYDDGFSAGYAAGLANKQEQILAECKAKISACERSASSSHPPSYSTSTEVCGGDGVNFNGKHYSGGKTGCVRVTSDGRVQRW